MFQHLNEIHRVQNGASVSQTVLLIWLGTVCSGQRPIKTQASWEAPAWVAHTDSAEHNWCGLDYLWGGNHRRQRFKAATLSPQWANQSYGVSWHMRAHWQTNKKKKARLTQHTLSWASIMAAAKTRERRRIWETWDGCHGRVKIEISPCHCGWKPETLFLTLGCVGTERFLFFVTAAGPLGRSLHHRGANIKALKSIRRRRRPASWSRSPTTLTTWPRRKSEERTLVNQNLSMFYHHASESVIKGDHCLVSSSQRKRHMDKWPHFFFLSPHARARPVLTPGPKF